MPFIKSRYIKLKDNLFNNLRNHYNPRWYVEGRQYTKKPVNWASIIYSLKGSQ